MALTGTADIQFNNLIPLPFAQPYIKIPTGLKGLTGGVQLVGGLIYTFSGVQDKDGVYSTMSRTRKAMKDKLLLSFPTLSRAVARLTETGYVSRLSRDEYIFNRDKLKSPDEFTRIEFKEIESIMDGCSRTQGVRLCVFAWFNARCNNDKKCSDAETEALRKEHKISASYSDIAAGVGCSDRQAIRAVKWLLKHDYIHRPKEDKGISVVNKSIYSLDRAYWRRKKIKEKPAAEHSPAPETPEQRATAAQKAWLDQVKYKAQIEADSNLKRAKADKRYTEAHKRVVGLTVEIAYTELKDKEKAAKLKAERELWVSEENAALQTLGLSAELLDEDYLFKLYSAGGAPPDGIESVGVG